MEKGLIAGLDVGTTKISLVIYDQCLNPLDFYILSNDTMVEGPVAEQDPLALISKIMALLKKAENKGVRKVGIAAYRGSLVAWSKSGEPLTNIITWMDLRSTINYNKIPLKAKIASRLPVIGPALSPESMAVKLKVLLHERPDIEEFIRNDKALAWNIDAFLIYSLTGKYIGDPSTAALTGLVDPSSLSPLNIVRRLLDLPQIRVPELPYHEELNTKYGDLVIGSIIGDQQASTIGLECLDKGCMKIGIGTGFFLDYSLGTNRSSSLMGKGLIPIILLYSRRRQVYGVEGYLTGMGKAIEWFVENLFDNDYRKMDSSINTHSKFPLVIPYIWGGRTPRLKRGLSGIIGLEPGYSSKDIANGLAHGVVSALLYVYKVITEKYGNPTRICVTGGLTRLRMFLKLLASYIGRDIMVYINHDASARGAALLASEPDERCGIDENMFTVIEPDPDIRILDPEVLVSMAKKLEVLKSG